MLVVIFESFKMTNKSVCQLTFPSYTEWYDSTKLQKLEKCIPNISFSAFP